MESPAGHRPLLGCCRLFGKWEGFPRTMVASLGITWHRVLMLLSYQGSALPRYPATSHSSSGPAWSCGGNTAQTHSSLGIASFPWACIEQNVRRGPGEALPATPSPKSSSCGIWLTLLGSFLQPKRNRGVHHIRSHKEMETPVTFPIPPLSLLSPEKSANSFSRCSRTKIP